MYIMTVEEMKVRKRELGYTNELVALKSGIPLGTVQKILSGATKAPRRSTLEALSRVLMREESRFQYLPPDPDYSELREPVPAYGRPESHGRYTAGDYYALPDEKRVELIDGVIFDMASPSKIHQGILQGIFVQLDRCMDSHRDTCFLYMAPSDVELGDREDTVVQPDLYIHCDKEKERNAPHRGAPDFVLEVLSPSNPQHDLWRKQELYRRHGVREYWIVDPEGKKVLVFDFMNSVLPTSYTFDETVPVLISGGTCSVDFKEVFARVAHLMQ